MLTLLAVTTLSACNLKGISPHIEATVSQGSMIVSPTMAFEISALDDSQEVITDHIIIDRDTTKSISNVGLRSCGESTEHALFINAASSHVYADLKVQIVDHVDDGFVLEGYIDSVLPDRVISSIELYLNGQQLKHTKGSFTKTVYENSNDFSGTITLNNGNTIDILHSVHLNIMRDFDCELFYEDGLLSAFCDEQADDISFYLGAKRIGIYGEVAISLDELKLVEMEILRGSSIERYRLTNAEGEIHAQKI